MGEHFNLRVYDKLNSNDIIENFHVLKIKPYEENGFVYEKWVLRNFSDIKPFYKEYKLFFLDDLLPNIRSVMYPITHNVNVRIGTTDIGSALLSEGGNAEIVQQAIGSNLGEYVDAFAPVLFDALILLSCFV